MKNKYQVVFKWLHPGMGIKRWIGLSAFGVVLVVIASSYLRSDEYWFLRTLDILVLISGIIILILGIKRLMRSFIAAFVPTSKGNDIVDMLYQKRQLGRGPKIVAIGGGTGLSVLLSGLKEYTSNITAIVTVADDGGSSGRLRQQFDILPPGDIRNCLVALADAPGLMRDLFQFRFTTDSELGGHSFGNLFITAMTQVTGDFEKALKEISKVLALRGQVIPSTLTNVILVAEHKDGTITEGEHLIPKAHLPIKKVMLKPEAKAATPEALKAIQEAQIIILGPGSLYTSIIPNLLIKEITDAIAASGAIKAYVCNAMTQPGETDGFKASDHVEALVQHSHPRIMDYCVLSTGIMPEHVAGRYERQGARQVDNDVNRIEELGYRVIEDEFVVSGDVIRHDPAKLAKILLSLLEEL